MLAGLGPRFFSYSNTLRPERQGSGPPCRRIVMEEYTMDRQVRQYAELYLKAFQQAVSRSS